MNKYILKIKSLFSRYNNRPFKYTFKSYLRFIYGKRKYIISFLLFLSIISLILFFDENIEKLFKLNSQKAQAYISAILTGLITFFAMWFIDAQNDDRAERSEYLIFIAVKKIELVKTMVEFQNVICDLLNSNLVEENTIPNIILFRKAIKNILLYERKIGSQTQLLCELGYLSCEYMDLTIEVFMLSDKLKSLDLFLKKYSQDSITLLPSKFNFISKESLEEYFVKKRNKIIKVIDEFNFKEKCENLEL